jgi:Heterokaryon incompatibility protein (HET)
MSIKNLSTSMSRIRELLRRLSSHAGSVLWISYLVFTRTCYHLPRILLHRPQENPAILRQSLALSKPAEEQQHQYLESYQYEPLPGHRYIRLLYRTESGGGADDEYDLCTLSLDDLIVGSRYRAISYTWDGQVPDRFIVCSGKKLAITQNCEMILRAMRRRDNMFLWIDAICIDSSSVNEKSSQIQLMSNIYSRAFVVDIWLGEPTEGTSILYSYFWLLWCCMAIPGPAGSWLKYQVHALMSGRFPSASTVSTSADRFVDRKHDGYIRDLSRRNWWRRVWTIQEAALAPGLGHLLVTSGAEEMPFECIISGLVECIGTLAAGEKYIFNEMIWTTALLAHHSPRLALIDPERRLDMQYFIVRNRACLATEPRDRVYGLYGMLQQLGLRLPQPSYLKTKGEVYWEFTVAACQHTASLELFRLVSSINADLSTPSWVPDYAEVFRVGDFLGVHKATGQSESHFYFTHDERRLVARGAVIDVVRAKSDLTIWQLDPSDSELEDGPLVNLDEGYEQTICAFRDWIKVLLKHGALDKYNSNERLLHAFSQSLTSGTTRMAESGRYTGEEYTSICHWLGILHGSGDHFEEVAIARSHPEIRERFYDDPTRRYLTESEEWQTLRDLKHAPCTAALHHAIWMMMRDRTFFVTSRGYMGTAPNSIRKGDGIVLLEGVSRPLIMRPSETSPMDWQLVCPAYIEGVMGGELWDDTVKLVDIPII